MVPVCFVASVCRAPVLSCACEMAIGCFLLLLLLLQLLLFTTLLYCCCMYVSRNRQVAVVDPNAYVCDLMATIAWRNMQRITPLPASTFWRPVRPEMFVSTLVAKCRLLSCSALLPEGGSANCGQDRAAWSCLDFEAKRVTYYVEMRCICVVLLLVSIDTSLVVRCGSMRSTSFCGYSEGTGNKPASIETQSV